MKDDLLRYHKTLLVWTANVDKYKTVSRDLSTPDKPLSGKASHKLQIVQTTLLNILRENKSGLSLAQIPLYLKRRLNFRLEWNELGYPKLKDFILSMPDKIWLDQRGHNHPYAKLVMQKGHTYSEEIKKPSGESLLYAKAQ